MQEGVHPLYGARNLKRALERQLVVPLANLLASGQLASGEFLTVDVDPVEARLLFCKPKKALQLESHQESVSGDKLKDSVMLAQGQIPAAA